jgi:hypothetical protein
MSGGATFVDWGAKLLNLAREPTKADPALVRLDRLTAKLAEAITDPSPPLAGYQRRRASAMLTLVT